MNFTCSDCNTTYNDLDDMEEVQVTEGMRDYICPNCDSDSTVVTLEYPTD